VIRPYQKARCHHELTRDILILARTGILKTRILQLANCPTKKFKTRIDRLAQKGLIKEKGSLWFTTGKGRQFIKNFQKCERVLNGI